MNDPRIAEYEAATRAMASGRFDVAIPVSGDDDVAQLGRALSELEEALERKFAEIRALLQITEQVNTGIMLEEVLDRVYELFRPILPYDRIGFSLLDADTAVVSAFWARTEAPHVCLQKGYSARIEGSSLQGVMETAAPRILNDLVGYLRDHPTSDSTRKIVDEGIRSSLTCPLIAMGKPIGFMFFSSMSRDAYVDAHVELFQQVAGQLAVIVEKARLYEELLETRKQLEAANRILGRLASQDGLTGLPNRRYFDEHFRAEWSRMQREKHALSLIMIDIDHFKQYNDFHGHLAGDECLKSMASVIRDALKRGTDVVARFGGEEFVVVLENTDAFGAVTVADHIRESVDELNLKMNDDADGDLLTVSLGVATTTVADTGTSLDLLAAADRALYQAKRDGRNCVRSASVVSGGKDEEPPKTVSD